MHSYTTGFFMFWGGISGMGFVIIAAVITFIRSRNREKRLSHAQSGNHADMSKNLVDQGLADSKPAVAQTAYLMETVLMKNEASLDETVLMKSEAPQDKTVLIKNDDISLDQTEYLDIKNQ